MKPTDEQQHAIDEFMTERDVKVIAYAGAGKTSTLVEMAKADEARGGLYIAFNKRIAEEADAKFPFNVRCSTAHSLACRVMRKQYDGDKLFKNPRMMDAGIVRFDGFTDYACREMVGRSLRRFMQSDDAEIEMKHAAPVEAAWDMFRVLKQQRGDKYANEWMDGLKDQIHRRAVIIWQRMISKTSALPLGHDGYLKLWAMGKPEIPTDILFVDEAQDLNPVLIGIIERQNCQVVSVGDSHQQIYEWRGAVDALEKLDGKRCRLTQSFRFGADIAAYADRALSLLGETAPLTGLGGPGTVEAYDTDGYTTEPIQAVLCRSNGGVISTALWTLDAGGKVYIPGGVGDLRAWLLDSERLKNGKEPISAEFVGFKTWPQVMEYSDSVDGEHLKPFIRLIEEHGHDRLMNMLQRVLPEPVDDAVTISTTHKAKGLEWDSVMVHEDFIIGGKKKDGGGRKITAAQVRLLYVAMTRAKRFLAVPAGMMEDYENAEITSGY